MANDSALEFLRRPNSISDLRAEPTTDAPSAPNGQPFSKPTAPEPVTVAEAPEPEPTPPDAEPAGGAEPASEDEVIVKVDVPVRVIVLVIVDCDSEALPAVIAPADSPLELGVETLEEVRVSGHTVVDIGTTEVTMLLMPDDGQSVTDAGQL